MKSLMEFCQTPHLSITDFLLESFEPNASVKKYGYLYGEANPELAKKAKPNTIIGQGYVCDKIAFNADFIKNFRTAWQNWGEIWENEWPEERKKTSLRPNDYAFTYVLYDKIDQNNIKGPQKFLQDIINIVLPIMYFAELNERSIKDTLIELQGDHWKRMINEETTIDITDKKGVQITLTVEEKGKCVIHLIKE